VVRGIVVFIEEDVSDESAEEREYAQDSDEAFLHLILKVDEIILE